jgi:outer membrane protein TolC
VLYRGVRADLAVMLVGLLSARATAGEPRAIGPFELEPAVAYAIAHHPALQAQQAGEEARRAQVSVGRAGYLPSLDLSAQINVGTGNVLRGGVFSMREIPNVSGPPTGRDIGDAALGSVIGVGIGWDAIGLVRQMAQVDAALAEASQAHAAVEVSRLVVAYAAADQFIDAISRAETVAAARVTVERMRVLVAIIKALVDQELRPGVDYSRAAAELALASTQLIRAEQAEALSRTALARALGAAGEKIQIGAGRLLEPASLRTAASANKSPELAEADAVVRASQARKHAVDLQYLPRLDLLGALWVRGSGLTSGMVAPSPGAGIVPDTPNWVTGICLTWPALELVAVRARSRVEAAQVKAAQARRSEVMQAVQSQIDAARETLEAARRIAENTPIALKAARDAEAQATARYRAGLATVDAVAEAERLLAQAEIDDAVARLNVRRAQLLLARAVGDLAPFFDELRGGR